MEELVNHPKHYQSNGKECIVEMEERFGKFAVLCFCVLNAFKYKFRAGNKASETIDRDHRKAQWYLRYGDELLDRLGVVGKFLADHCHLRQYIYENIRQN